MYALSGIMRKKTGIFSVVDIIEILTDIMHKDVDAFIKKSLKEHFSDEITEKLIKFVFKEYME